MSCAENNGGHRLFRSQLVRGEPYHVGGQTLIPVAHVTSFGRGKATIGQERIGGWGFAFTRVTPVAIVVKTDMGQRRVPIYDRTGDTLLRLCFTALALVSFFAALRRWFSHRREARKA
jgi:uncharacterized spore protein YtfJ